MGLKLSLRLMTRATVLSLKVARTATGLVARNTCVMIRVGR